MGNIFGKSKKQTKSFILPNLELVTRVKLTPDQKKLLWRKRLNTLHILDKTQKKHLRKFGLLQKKKILHFSLYKDQRESLIFPKLNSNSINFFRFSRNQLTTMIEFGKVKDFIQRFKRIKKLDLAISSQTMGERQPSLHHFLNLFSSLLLLEEVNFYISFEPLTRNQEIKSVDSSHRSLRLKKFHLTYSNLSNFKACNIVSLAYFLKKAPKLEELSLKLPIVWSEPDMDKAFCSLMEGLSKHLYLQNLNLELISSYMSIDHAINIGKSLSKLSRLTELSIILKPTIGNAINPQIINAIMECCSEMKNLAHFYINTSRTNNSPSEDLVYLGSGIKNLANLREFFLLGSAISGLELKEALEKIPNPEIIRALGMEVTKYITPEIGDFLYQFIKKMKNIKKFYLIVSEIDEDQVSIISILSKLVKETEMPVEIYLELIAEEASTDEVKILSEYLRGLKHLKSLKLQMKASNLVYLGDVMETLPGLEAFHLDINDVYPLSKECIVNLFYPMANMNLKQIDLSIYWCNNVAEQDIILLIQIVRLMTNLRELRLHLAWTNAEYDFMGSDNIHDFSPIILELSKTLVSLTKLKSLEVVLLIDQICNNDAVKELAQSLMNLLFLEKLYMHIEIKDENQKKEFEKYLGIILGNLTSLTSINIRTPNIKFFA